MSNGKILVTGGSGYTGSVLVSRLLEEGYQVTVIDNFVHDRTSLLGYCHYPKLNIIRGDVRNRDHVAKAVKDADFILPLAAIVGVRACDRDPIAARTTNVDAIKMLLELRSKGQGIVFPCTNSGYGIGQEDTFCTEETPLHPISLYGQLKVEAEKAILDSGNSISLRLATVFGTSPCMRLDLLVNDFVYRAVTDRFVVLFEGHFRRNYIHVRDVAKAFIHCLNSYETMRNEVYNVGLSNANLSKLDLCELIKEQVPHFYFVESKVGEDPDKRNYIVSNAKIEATGFKPDVSLQMGIAELIKGYEILGGR